MAVLPTRGLPLGLPLGLTAGEVRGEASDAVRRRLGGSRRDDCCSRSGVGGWTKIDRLSLALYEKGTYVSGEAGLPPSMASTLSSSPWFSVNTTPLVLADEYGILSKMLAPSSCSTRFPPRTDSIPFG
jgi:hypothetical protein